MYELIKEETVHGILSFGDGDIMRDKECSNAVELSTDWKSCDNLICNSSLLEHTEFGANNLRRETNVEDEKDIKTTKLLLLSQKNARRLM